MCVHVCPGQSQGLVLCLVTDGEGKTGKGMSTGPREEMVGCLVGRWGMRHGTAGTHRCAHRAEMVLC